MNSKGVANTDVVLKLKQKIAKIKKQILRAQAELKSNHSVAADIMKEQQKLRKLIDDLRKMKTTHTDAAQEIGLDDLIAEMEGDIEFPNLPRQSLSHGQLELQESARQIIDLWSSAGTGVDYDSLSVQSKQQVTRLIEASELSTILAEQIERNYTQFKSGPANQKQMLLLLESIKKLFQKKIAESCSNDRREIDINPDDPDHRRYLKTLAATSVVSILKSLTGPLSMPNVVISAAVADPAKFMRDAGSLFFAGGVLTQCLPQGFGGGVGIVSDIARAITTFMAQNPLEAFVSGQWTNAQIKKLYKMALRQMYPDLDDHTIRGIVDRMDADFLARSRVGLTGEAPVDVVTLTGKLRYLIYLFKDICVGQAAFTGDMVRTALDFPNALCQLANHAIAKLKSLSASASAHLMGRYQIIPGESLETFEDLLMTLLNRVEFEDVEAVKRFIARLIQRNNVPTVWEISVDFWTAQSDMLNPITGNTGNPENGDSLGCAASWTPRPPLSPARPFEEFGIPPDAGTIPGQSKSSVERWGDWVAVFRFLNSPPMDPRQASVAPAQSFPRQPCAGAPVARQPCAGAPVARQDCARGGDSHIPFPSQGSQVPAASTAASTAASNIFATTPQPSCTQGYPPSTSKGFKGGRYHSHKRSASKRTRHKVLTGKKQKSKKNKRQSCRKVRCASSHRSRK